MTGKLKFLCGVALSVAVLAGGVSLSWAEDQAAFSPTRFTVTEEGASGHPDILLLPGLASSRAVWADEAQALAPQYRLHLVQISGFGTQPPADNAQAGPLVQGIVDQLHSYIASRHLHPVVIGHSLGGLMGLLLAKEHPEDVAKLIVVDATPFAGLLVTPTATVHNVQPIAAMMRDGTMKLSADQRRTMEQQVSQGLAKSEAGRSRIMEDGLASDLSVTARAMYEDMQTDLRPDLPAIKTPTLVLYAADPTLLYPNGIRATSAYVEMVMKQAYQGLPNVTFARIDDARHFVMFDQPEKTRAEIGKFLGAN